MKYILEINQFVLPISVGAQAEERSKPQEISFKIIIEFGSKPMACESDDISDTVCYAKLIEAVERFCLGKEFYLIEQLANEMHTKVKASLLSPMDKLSLKVCKIPPLEKIKGNCCFIVAD